MYEAEDVNITHVPHNFKVACVLFGLPIRALLQLFIDHVSFYHVFGSKEVGPHTLATRTLAKYVHEKKADKGHEVRSRMAISEENRDKSVALIRLLVKLSSAHDLSDAQQRKSAKPLIKKLRRYMSGAIVKASTLYLNKEEKLQLTDDFCLICEIHKIHPLEHLTNFMRELSPADHYARARLNKLIENPAMAFFLIASKGYGGLNLGQATHKKIKIEFIDEMQEAHLNLFIYRSLAYRKARYQDILDNYYQQIIKQEQ